MRAVSADRFRRRWSLPAAGGAQRGRRCGNRAFGGRLKRTGRFKGLRRLRRRFLLTRPQMRLGVRRRRSCRIKAGSWTLAYPIGNDDRREMTANPKSDGFRTVITATLSVGNGPRAIAFYKTAFDAVELHRVDGDDGSAVAQMSVSGAEFWVADESPEHLNFSPESLGGGSVRMILTVPDPDAMFATAIAAGAQEVVAVKEDYGWRLGRVVDPFGHHWEIGRPLAS